MKLHHIAWASNNIESTLTELTNFASIDANSAYTFDIEQKGALLRLVKIDGIQFEFIDGTIANSFTHNGNNLYHLCFESKDYDNDIANIKQLGWVAITGDRNAILFEGMRVSFYKKPGYPLVEIKEA